MQTKISHNLGSTTFASYLSQNAMKLHDSCCFQGLLVVLKVLEPTVLHYFYGAKHLVTTTLEQAVGALEKKANFFSSCKFDPFHDKNKSPRRIFFTLKIG
jgi:hypothetical protein